MKRIALAAALAAIVAAQLPAIDIGITYDVGNLGFPWNSTSPTSADLALYPLTYCLHGGSLSLKEKLGESLSINANYSLENGDRSKLVSMITYGDGPLLIGIGPLFGVFNSLQQPLTAGISTLVHVEIPGIVFLRFRADSTLGGDLTAIGDSSQSSTLVEGGWYGRNAICTLSMGTNEFKLLSSADLTTTDARTEYALKVDIFKKNQPYNILFDLGYRTLSKSYLTPAGLVTDSLGQVVLGTGIVIKPTSALEINLKCESGIYTFGLDNLAGRGPNPNEYVFTARAGFLIKTDELPRRAKTRVEPEAAGASATPVTNDSPVQADSAATEPASTVAPEKTPPAAGENTGAPPEENAPVSTTTTSAPSFSQ